MEKVIDEKMATEDAPSTATTNPLGALQPAPARSGLVSRM